MEKKGSIFEGVRFGIRTEEEVAVEALFPTRDKFKMLQMITDQPPKAIIPFSVLGVFRRRYHSDTLKMFQEEYSLNKIAQERLGRRELGEIVAAIKKPKEEEE